MKIWKILLFLGIACVVLSVAQPDEQEEEPTSDQSSQVPQEPIQLQPGLVQPQPVGSIGGPGGFHGFCPWRCRRHPWTWRCRRFWGCRRFGHWRGMTAEDDQSGLEMDPAASFMMGNEMMEGSESADMMDDAAMDKDGMQMDAGKEDDDDEDKTDYKRYLFCPWKCRLLGSLMPHHCSKLEGCRRYMRRTRPDKNKPEDESKSSSGVEAAVETTEQGEKEDLIRRPPLSHPRPLPHPLPIRRPWCPLHCRTRPFIGGCRRFPGCRFWLHRPGMRHGVAEDEAANEADQQGDTAVEGVENQENLEGRMDDDLRRWQFCPWRCRLMGSLMPWRCRRLPACQRHMRKGLKEPIKPGSFPGHGPGQLGAEAEAEAEGQNQQEVDKDVEGNADGDKDVDQEKYEYCPRRCRVPTRLGHMPTRCLRIKACERYLKLHGGVEAQTQVEGQNQQQEAEKDVEGRRRRDDNDDDDKDDDKDKDDDRDELRNFKFCPKKCRALARLGHRMPKRCRRLDACERYLKKRVKHHRERDISSDDDKMEKEDRDGVASQVQPQTGVDKTRLPAPDIADKFTIKRCPPICRRLPHLGICLRSPFCPRPFCPLFCRKNPFLPRCRIYLGCRRHNLPIVAKTD